MGRDGAGTYHPKRWTPPTYTVDDDGKIVGGYTPTGPNNWGRWGNDDKRGTANLIDAEAIRYASSLVQSGQVISLALPIDEAGPRWPGRPAPKHYFSMTGSDGITGLPYSGLVPGVTYTDDYLDMPLQGSSQWDGLAHWAYQDSLYNGYWAGNIGASTGSPDLDIAALKNSFVGRGVLIDVARHLGVEYVEPGMPITAEMVDEIAAAQGVEFRTGDILLIRTGYLKPWYSLADENAQRAFFAKVPGLSRDMIPWFKSHDIAAVAADTVSVEVMPNEEPIDRPQPIHHAALIDLGLTLGEFWWLDDLGDACAEDGRYEFLLSAPPLNIPGAVGSMINPMAIK
jgi:kynurenine formamidase